MTTGQAGREADVVECVSVPQFLFFFAMSSLTWVAGVDPDL